MYRINSENKFVISSIILKQSEDIYKINLENQINATYPDIVSVSSNKSIFEGVRLTGWWNTAQSNT